MDGHSNYGIPGYLKRGKQAVEGFRWMNSDCGIQEYLDKRGAGMVFIHGWFMDGHSN